MTLQQYIVKVGTYELAYKTGIEHNIIKNWLYGRSIPRPHHMVLLYQCANGSLSYKTMVEESAYGLLKLPKEKRTRGRSC